LTRQSLRQQGGSVQPSDGRPVAAFQGDAERAGVRSEGTALPDHERRHGEAKQNDELAHRRPFLSRQRGRSDGSDGKDRMSDTLDLIDRPWKADEWERRQLDLMGEQRYAGAQTPGSDFARCRPGRGKA
jgi:hypothetical protein